MISNNNLKNLYNDLYNNGYHSDPKYSHSKIFLNFIRQEIPLGSKILDVGCSTGCAVSILKSMGYDSYGIDISDVAVEEAKKYGIQNIIQGCTDNIPYDNNIFDAIICTDVLEHVPMDNIINTVSEFNRILKHNGKLYLRICLSLEKNTKYQKIVNKHGIKNLHIAVAKPDVWIKLFESSFTIEQTNQKNSIFPNHLHIIAHKK